jgi:hypothetical protein
VYASQVPSSAPMGGTTPPRWPQSREVGPPGRSLGERTYHLISARKRSVSQVLMIDTSVLGLVPAG